MSSNRGNKPSGSKPGKPFGGKPSGKSYGGKTSGKPSSLSMTAFMQKGQRYDNTQRTYS